MKKNMCGQEFLDLKKLPYSSFHTNETIDEMKAACAADYLAILKYFRLANCKGGPKFDSYVRMAFFYNFTAKTWLDLILSKSNFMFADNTLTSGFRAARTVRYARTCKNVFAKAKLPYNEAVILVGSKIASMILKFKPTMISACELYFAADVMFNLILKWAADCSFSLTSKAWIKFFKVQAIAHANLPPIDLKYAMYLEAICFEEPRPSSHVLQVLSYQWNNDRC